MMRGAILSGDMMPYGTVNFCRGCLSDRFSSIARMTLPVPCAGCVERRGRKPAYPRPAVCFLLPILLIAYSASAVMVSEGLTPGLAGMTEPSMMYKPS